MSSSTKNSSPKETTPDDVFPRARPSRVPSRALSLSVSYRPPPPRSALRASQHVPTASRARLVDVGERRPRSAARRKRRRERRRRQKKRQFLGERGDARLSPRLLEHGQTHDSLDDVHVSLVHLAENGVPVTPLVVRPGGDEEIGAAPHDADVPALDERRALSRQVAPRPRTEPALTPNRAGLARARTEDRARRSCRSRPALGQPPRGGTRTLRTERRARTRTRGSTARLKGRCRLVSERRCPRRRFATRWRSIPAASSRCTLRTRRSGRPRPPPRRARARTPGEPPRVVPWCAAECGTEVEETETK